MNATVIRWSKLYTNVHTWTKVIAINRKCSTKPRLETKLNELVLLGQKYATDKWTNITPDIISKLGRNLHIQKYHPLSLLRQRIIDYFYTNYRNRTGSPIFSVFDNISPIVTVTQNFDSLLVPKDHPSRSKTDCYYINEDILLRAHTTAHQAELISMGLNSFLVVGDVYRRDEIDKVHYPIFHQIDGVRTYTIDQILKNINDTNDLKLFEHRGIKTSDKQDCYTLESVEIMKFQLQHTLIGLAQAIFGKDVKYRWVEQYFPFTHPSWELEVFYNNNWLEILGCGIIQQEILQQSGARDHIGWAFGMGMERLAMCLYDIPDIRLFWSQDSGFLNQFKVDDPNTQIQYKPVSIFPQCCNDLSFWLPQDRSFSQNDFYDIARKIGGDIIEQILLKDEYVNPKNKKVSHCYRMVYRRMDRTLTQEEVSYIHKKIEKAITEELNVIVR